jgi:hypothetical protein
MFTTDQIKQGYIEHAAMAHLQNRESRGAQAFSACVQQVSSITKFKKPN